MKKNIRIEFAQHKRVIRKSIDIDGCVTLRTAQNYNNEHGAFKLSATDYSDFDGLEVTVCLSAHHSFEEAAEAAIKAASTLSPDEQQRTEQHVREHREQGLALEAKIAKNTRWTNRKLEINWLKLERQRLGYE